MAPTLRQCLLAEVLGTAFLLLFGTGAVVVDEQTHALGHGGVAAAFGLIVLLIIQGLGHVSGAHVNPAVTIGFWAAGRFPARRVLPYVAAQLVGALVGSGLVWFGATPGSLLGATLPAHSVGQAFSVELGLTFWLMLIILRVTASYYEQGLLIGLTISATVALEALVGGPLSGASMNPARSLAPAILSGHLTAAWVYIAAPLAGVLLAVVVNQLLEPRQLLQQTRPAEVYGNAKPQPYGPKRRAGGGKPEAPAQHDETGPPFECGACYNPSENGQVRNNPSSRRQLTGSR